MADISARAFHARNFVPIAEEQLTIDNTVGGIALTPATYGTAKFADITVEDADIRTSVVGVPTATFGHILSPPDTIELESAEDIAAFRAIRVTGTNAVIHVIYKDIKLS